MKQLVILSKLRDLSEIAKSTVKKMPIVYDIKKDAFYKEGLEEGKLEIIIQLIKSGELTYQKIA